VDGTDSGSCPAADFGISGVEPSGSVITALVSNIYTKPRIRNFRK
jgi:hypothetical protein